MSKLVNTLPGAIILTLMLTLTGCGAAIAAGAGAGAAIAYSERGASSNVDASLEQVYQSARATFSAMGITGTAQDIDDADQEREIQGTRGDLEITVDMQRSDNGLTSINVYAQESTVEWDREYAREVLANMLGRL